jgi:glutaredoxin 3
MGATSSRENEAAALAFVDRVTSENAVTVFSKSYCPYCDLVRTCFPSARCRETVLPQDLSVRWCVWREQAKDVLSQAGVKYFVVELDRKSDDPSGPDIQSALATKTGACAASRSACNWCSRPDSPALLPCYPVPGRSTVPNVFLQKQSIGGGTDVQALFQSGKLNEMLRATGVLQ